MPLSFLIGRLCLLFLPLFLIGVSITVHAVRENKSGLTVSFLNIGQGDAIFIETPDKKQILLDGGPDSGILRELGAVMPWYDRTLDLVIASHPDQDHVGGLVSVFKRYQVANIMHTGHEGDAPAATAYNNAAAAENAIVHIGRGGQVYRFGEYVTLTIYSPMGEAGDLPTNTASLVMKLSYGTSDFLLTGDAPSGIEEYLTKAYGPALESEVLKLGHHGSDTSTSQTFLDTVRPRYAIVSAGARNRYGHPHQTVINRIEAANIKLGNTATDGRITFVSNGTALWLE